ncbi:nucleotidyltransferase [Conexibacter sp. SYSU D00693]|uniref:nucleotidyltransferase n=1 Tax=Conexibacter sp. SYSU D00693 TaxID=2812560 RepID=UPI00196ADA9D|nr:nucleotidyltransferase [Conexibacter sp. SYSU D00693]
MAYDDQAEHLIPTLRRSIAALRDADVPFALGGSVACWARGGPAPYHDVDLMVPPNRAEEALAALGAAGMRTEKPPEGWLYKAFDGDVLVDVIFEPTSITIDEACIEACETVNLQAMECKALPLEDVFVSKLNALDELNLDFSGLLAIARPVREQVDWSDVRERTSESPYARAFVRLAEDLGVVPAAAEPA